MQELLDTDDGASRLVEVALVPFGSPVSNSGILFYNTLFDENAVCHLALGRMYPTCLDGGPRLSVEERLARGLNNFLVHEDFMIGTANLAIDGVREDGIVIPVFRQGIFVDILFITSIFEYINWFCGRKFPAIRKVLRLDHHCPKSR